jgi:hypothetical protein
VRDHDTPSCAKRVLCSLDSLGDGTNLVDLEQQSVACLLVDGLLNERRVGDSQIITYLLSVFALLFTLAALSSQGAYPTIWKSEVL